MLVSDVVVDIKNLPKEMGDSLEALQTLKFGTIFRMRAVPSFGWILKFIRNIDAPFIPRLRSITDTSYFPTDELEQVPDEPVGADTTGASKDLAFLGYVFPFPFLAPACDC